MPEINVLSENIENPKAIISYSWSSQEHEQWVINLATDLRQSGVDVILDKWDLKEGHDAIHFMEKMVTDPEIKKVIMISDHIYAEKADGRKGGVGTETQIISKEIYEKAEQDKFVVVIVEKDKNGLPYLPTYYKSRIYIDLSDPDKYSENFEKLLRWIYNKPLYIKPELGSIPLYLTDTGKISLETSAIFRRTIDAIKNRKPYASGSLTEYFETFATNIEKFRIKEFDGEYDDAVIENIELFLGYTNEAIQIFSAIAKYESTDENIENIHRFFETIIPYIFKPASGSSSQESEFDNYRFLIYELFLYAIAIFIKLERFQQIGVFLSKPYYVQGDTIYGRNELVLFPVFAQQIISFDYRNKRLKLKRRSMRVDLLKDRCGKTGVEFRFLMQADFVLYVRSCFFSEGYYPEWLPMTRFYLGHYPGPFEIFARAKSARYFENIIHLLNIKSKTDIEKLLKDIELGKKRAPNLNEWEPINVAGLMNAKQLATIPQ